MKKRCFGISIKRIILVKIKKHWRSSPYISYSNWLFTHVHARLNKRERPNYFWNGLLLTGQREGLDYLPTFRELQRSFCHFMKSQKIDVLLLEPIKAVIGCCHPSSRTLLLRTQMLVSHANIVTWDVLLQSLLSCLPGLSFTSKSEMRHQPKRYFTPENHCRFWSCQLCSIPHNLLSWLGPSHQQDGIHWVPMCL